MKNSLLFLIAFFLLGTTVLTAQEGFRKMAPKPGAAPKIELGESKSFKLDNGLTVIVSENHKLPRVSFQLTVDVPDFTEGQYAGTASMAGQLLGTGTTERSKAEIDEAVDFLGANFTTYSGGMFGSSLTKHQDKLLEIMAEVLYKPAFPEAEFEKIKKQTLSGLASAKDSPDAISSNVSNVMVYGADHPYGEITTEETVENITLDRCKSYYNTYFKPNISYLTIVGDITPAKAKELAMKYFGNWEKGMVDKPTFTTPKAPAKTQVDFVDKTGAVQSVINITYPVELAPGHPDAIKARVMNTILGGGMFGSRLMQNIREDKGYSYGFYSSLSSDKLIGEFSAGGSVRNEVTDSAIVETLKEMEILRNEKVTEDDLQSIKNYLTGNFARSLERPQTVANFALNTIRYNLPDDYYATYLKRLNAVTTEDIMAMAKKYLKPANAHIVVVGNKDEVAETLAKFGPVNFYDIYGNVKEEVAMDMPSDVDASTVLYNYLQALGGADKLKAVKNVKTNMSASVQGMTINMEMVKTADGKMMQTSSMGGNVMSKTVFNGEKGISSQMGQNVPIEGEQAAAMKAEAYAIPELNYAKMGVSTELKGMEEVNGVNTYKLVVTNPDGSKSTQYFDAETGLKVKTVASQEANGQTMTIIQEIGDYKEVNGIKFPYSMKITGMAPFPLEMKTESVETNVELPADAFKVE